MTEKAAGGRGSFETSEQNQGIAQRFGQIGPVDTAKEISAPPAPIRDFIAAQEPLGIEFERILFDNLWELYAR